MRKKMRWFLVLPALDGAIFAAAPQPVLAESGCQLSMEFCGQGTIPYCLAEGDSYEAVFDLPGTLS